MDPAGVMVGLGIGVVGVFNGVILSLCVRFAGEGEGDMIEFDDDSDRVLLANTKS